MVVLSEYAMHSYGIRLCRREIKCKLEQKKIKHCFDCRYFYCTTSIYYRLC